MISRIPLAIRIALIFLIQAGIVFWMVWDRSQILANGQVVQLKVIPVDPRDIFRGDYVILDYEISNIHPEKLGNTEKFEKHEIVFVGLAKSGDGFWRPSSIHHLRPEQSNGEVIIQGRVQYSRGRVVSDGDATTCDDGTCQELLIKYGIESYFVPEGEGSEIEDARDKLDVAILAAVSPLGRAAIKGLLIDGALRYEEPLF